MSHEGQSSLAEEAGAPHLTQTLECILDRGSPSSEGFAWDSAIGGGPSIGDSRVSVGVSDISDFMIVTSCGHSRGRQGAVELKRPGLIPSVYPPMGSLDHVMSVPMSIARLAS